MIHIYNRTQTSSGENEKETRIAGKMTTSVLQSRLTNVFVNVHQCEQKHTSDSKRRNSLFDMKYMGKMHKMYSQKVPVITKISSFIECELFWFAVCTLSHCLWVVLKSETTSFSEQILNFNF